MIDLQLAKELRDRLADEFADVYVGAPLDASEIALPAILLGIESDVVVGSLLQRGTLTASVQSSADDSTYDAHESFAASVDAFLRAQEVDGDGMRMWLPVAQRVSTTQADRHWVSELQYTIGFSAQ